MFKNRRVFGYIISEIIPSFLLGIFVFIGVLLMFQALRLTEFLLVHGIKWTTMIRIMGYMSISFLPMLLPMSLLFAVLLTYNRFSMDSEIIAFKSCGVNTGSIILPALVFSFIVTLISSQTSFYLAPWGNRQFEVLINRLGNTKAAASIKEGTFSEGFFDMVVYANKVDPQTGLLSDLFIYDEKNPETPLTIVASEGQVTPDQTKPGHSVLLRLFRGQIHRRTETHTVINFDSFDILLNDPIKLQEKQKTASSLNLTELQILRQKDSFSTEQRKEFDIEYHKRGALSVTCLVFCLLGLAFGIITNRRSGKSSGFVLSVAFIIAYWIIYLSFESLVRSNQINTLIGLWLPNVLFTVFGLYHLRKSWN
ncbi:MAG: LPS export ABC transporter permease LptF [Bdellovibrionota bacterium]